MSKFIGENAKGGELLQFGKSNHFCTQHAIASKQGEHVVEKIKIHHFKALKNLEISFSPQVNLISGANGVGKSSILQLIANAFNDVKRRDFPALPIIRESNEIWNPKLEDLSSLDQRFGDVAKGTKGALLEITYAYPKLCLSFRRQNKRSDAKQGLCRLIPKIPRGSGISLPTKPRIYLGARAETSLDTVTSSVVPSVKLAESIANLESKMLNPEVTVSKNELQSLLALIKNEFVLPNQTPSKTHRPKTLPQYYLAELRKLYISFTGHHINLSDFSKNPKANFTTMKAEVDHRTISSGDLRLLDILYALISLRLYHDTTKLEDRSSLLLIDDLDTELHHKTQKKLLTLLRDYSQRYQIQVIATSHSTLLLQDAYAQDHMIHLQKVKQHTRLVLEEDLILAEIEPNLSYRERNRRCPNGCIAFFVEDDEAKLFFDFILEKSLSDPLYGNAFQKIKHIIRPVVASLGHIQIGTLMERLPQWPLFAIIDGDGVRDITKHIIKLPSYGKTSPEKTVHRYYQEELRGKPQNQFWSEEPRFQVQKLNSIFDQLNGIKKKKQKARLIYKKHFKKYTEIYRALFMSWMRDHPKEMETFYRDFCNMFNKAARNAGIPDRMSKIKRIDVLIQPPQDPPSNPSQSEVLKPSLESNS